MAKSENSVVSDNFIRNRRKIFFVIFMYFFSCGLDFSVIIPSCWLYLQDRFQADPIWLGVVIGANSFASLLFGPISGRICDKLQQTRLILLISMLFPIFGNFMYSLGIAPWFLTLSRFISGIGIAQICVVLVNVSSGTSLQERTPYVAGFFMAQILGAIIGPTFHLGLRYIYFYMGPFLIDGLSSPGIVLAIYHVILYAIIYAWYYDIIHPENSNSSSEGITDKTVSGSDSPDPAAKQGGIVKELLQMSIFTVLTALVVIQFTQNSIATGVAPVTELYYNFGDFENSLVFLYCAVVVLLVCVAISLISQCVSDKLMIVTGTILTLIGLVIYIVVFPTAEKGDLSTLTITGVAMSLQSVGVPLVTCAGNSLLSKLISNQYQGVTFGIRRALCAIAETVAPLWAGGSALANLYVYFGGILTLHIITAMLILFSWKRLTPGMCIKIK